MAIRRRQVHPDQMLATQTYGEIPYVSYEALAEAMLQLASTLDLAGGYAAVVLDRHPTDVPSEMVTVGAVIEWKDRTTDARPAPERSVVSTPLPDPQPEPEPQPEPPTALQPVPELRPEPDGLDPSTLDEEDMSSIEPTVR
jgi:fused signal recognition particle receptor